MNNISVTILSIVLMIFLGYFLKRIDFLSEKDIDSFNKLVMYVLLPCMVFSALYNADLSLLPKLKILPLVILFSSFITGLISFFILKILGLDNKKLWSVLVAVMIANTAFMGYPINLGVFGPDGFLRAIFCDIATMCIFLILSFVLVLNFGGSVKKAFKKILMFPPLWAIILGLLFNIFSIPIGPVFDRSISYLGDGTIPLIMISLGISINFKGFSRNKLFILFVSFFKLVVFPLIAFFIVIFLGLVDLQFDVAVVEAAMPSGMLSLVLAISYGLDYKLTSDCILINTVISLITLPLIIMLL